MALSDVPGWLSQYARGAANLGSQSVLPYQPSDLHRVHDDGLPLEIHPDHPPARLAILLQEGLSDQQMLLVVSLYLL